MKPCGLLVLASLSCGAAGQGQLIAPAPPGGGWEIAGTVKNRSGPLKGLFVNASGPGLVTSTGRTDSQGRYTLRGAVPGTYSIWIEKTDNFSTPRSRTLTVASGQKVSDVDMVVPEGAVITGKVMDGAGRPVSGLAVVAYDRVHHQGPHQGPMRLVERGGARTDDRGEYRIRHLPAGSYLVGVLSRTMRNLLPVLNKSDDPVSSPPAFPPVTFAPAGRNQAAASVIVVHEGEERTGVDVTLEKEPGHCVSFRASTPQSDPNHDVKIWLLLREWVDADGPVLVNATVPVGQESQICGLPKGEYRLNLLGVQQNSGSGAGCGGETVLVRKPHTDLGTVTITGMQELKGTIRVRGEGTGEPVPEGIQVRLAQRGAGLLSP